MFRNVLQTWDCFTRISILQTIEYQYALSQWQLREGDRPNRLSANYFVLHDHRTGTVNRLKAWYNLTKWQRLRKTSKIVDCATKYQKLHEDSKQHNSTLTLRTCHCAECGTIWIWKIMICTTKQSHPKKHWTKNNVLECASNMGLLHSHFDFANHWISIRSFAMTVLGWRSS